jgi:hypothetical protein
VVEELVARLLIECATVLAAAAFAQLLRWLAARLGLVATEAPALPAEIARVALRLA